ncbi:MAG TPA: cell division protein FtsL [Methylophilaceae bacterium]|nr:cell division protein FtsL [Methylophilaceae bacterium]
MTRLNLILFFVLIVTALGSVTAQHKSRKYYFELQQQQDAAKQYDIEWGQLQLEQSTWAMHSRVESVASQQLHMQVPDNKRIQVVVSTPKTVSKVLPAIDVTPLAAPATGMEKPQP